jgi:hypothetical protein
VKHCRSISRQACPKKIVASLAAVTIFTIGCSGTARFPDAGTGSIVIPVQFVDKSGASISPNERPKSLEARFGAVPGSIFGTPIAPFEPQHVDRAGSLAINLSEFGSVYGKMAETIHHDKLTSGLTIVPADTRFARLGTLIKYESAPRPPSMSGFVDSGSKKALLLVYFDKPCRLTGTILTPPREGETTHHEFDVTIDRAGLNWLVVDQNLSADSSITRHADSTVRPAFVVRY